MNDEGRTPPHDESGGAETAGAGAAGSGSAGAESVGSVAEEAMKLFGALSDWAREHGGDGGAKEHGGGGSANEHGGGVGEALSGAAAGAARAFHDLNEHVATGSEECKYCPVCRAVHTVRELSPEVKAHLAVAGNNLLQAAAALMATAVPDHAQGDARRSDGVERIPVDDDWGGSGPFGSAPADAGPTDSPEADGPAEEPPTP